MRQVLWLRRCHAHPGFPFLFGGTFIEAHKKQVEDVIEILFPFLFGGTFIEAMLRTARSPSHYRFPFLFGGTFIEANGSPTIWPSGSTAFPFLFGGTFIEALRNFSPVDVSPYFPSFSEGLSLRQYKPICERKTSQGFPFLFGGTFIEAEQHAVDTI